MEREFLYAIRYWFLFSLDFLCSPRIQGVIGSPLESNTDLIVSSNLTSFDSTLSSDTGDFSATYSPLSGPGNTRSERKSEYADMSRKFSHFWNNLSHFPLQEHSQNQSSREKHTPGELFEHCCHWSRNDCLQGTRQSVQSDEEIACYIGQEIPTTSASTSSSPFLPE